MKQIAIARLETQFQVNAKRILELEHSTTHEGQKEYRLMLLNRSALKDKLLQEYRKYYLEREQG